VTQQSVVRHYSAQTRAEVEQAYRADALKAARAGYVASEHTWSQDAGGLLLAVTYSGPPPQPAQTPAPVTQPKAPAQTRPTYETVQRITPVQRAPQQPPLNEVTPTEPTIVAAEPQPVSIRDLNGMAAPAAVPIDQFDMGQPEAVPDTFAPSPQPAQQGVLESQWLPPQQVEPPMQVERYTPPAEMYAPDPQMYVPVQASQAEGGESGASAASGASAQSGASAEPVPAPEALGRQSRLTVQVMDLHTAGEPLRMVRSGFPDVPMLPVLQRRQWVRDNADHVRHALMFEPRGHKDMYGAILLPPYNDYADMTVLFMHNEGYSTMCGHGVIAITTGLIEEGLFPATEPVTTIRYEVPAGIVAANAATVKLDDGSWAVRGVRFTNVPSYLAAQSLSVRPDGVALYGTAAQYGAIGVDIAFGGAYYGIVNAAEVGLRVVPEQADELRRVGAAITDVLRRDHTPAHPSDPDLSFVYGTIIVDLDPRTSPDGKARDAHIRNATIFAEAELDRSPCGSGTSAILAQLHARGRIRVGQEIVNAGITGEHFLGRVEAETALGPYAAVSTSIAGTAYVTGYSTFIVDSRDPLGDGFLLG
jgi:trans-L-3-hydroxyproline dehydratase